MKLRPEDHILSQHFDSSHELAIRGKPCGMPDAFWKTKSLAEMSKTEWESLCDGCGRCCLNKLEDEDTGRFLYTKAACKLLDLKTCQCTDYNNRHARVPDCIALTPKNVSELGWLPESCAYRRLAEGLGLSWWHPLVSGSPDTVKQAGISVVGIAYSEKGIMVDELVDHLWKLPKAKRKEVKRKNSK